MARGRMGNWRVVLSVGGTITVAAVVGSLVTGSWLILVLGLVLALVALAAFVVRPRPTAIRDDRGTLVVCPNCHGTTFFEVRSPTGLTAGFLILGWLGALIAPRSQIRCTTCGATYPRP